MKQKILKYFKKTFSIYIVISRFFQISISMLMTLIVFYLANKTGQNELAQGFYSGATFIFMLENLKNLFIKK